jgi:anaerobic magnesium-protoporphyrin IX monomethyl ester cyclase
LINSICLIIPQSPFLLDERVFMHIGVLKVASVLRQKGCRVDVLDFAGVKEEDSNHILDIYMKENPKITTFGFTATTPQIPFAANLSAYIKKRNPDVKLILGGTHFSLMHSAYKKEVKLKKKGRAHTDIERLKSIFDVLVAGDGEKIIFNSFNLKKGILDADDPKTEFFLSSEEFSTFPMPARDLVDIDSYHYSIEGHKAVSLIAQLGCPFHCTFCGGRLSPFLRRIRTRDVESILHEVEFLYREYGFTGFMFYDDELNVSKYFLHMLKGLVDLQKKYKTEFKLRGFVKAELLTQEHADLMYEAGFRWLLTGFESGDERILINIQKNADLAANTRCITYAKNSGLKVKALMSIGHAGESVKTIENTKDWLLDVKPEDFDCTIITTYPGSPYFDDAKLENGVYVYESPKTGDKLYQKDLDYFSCPDYYKGDPKGGYKAYVWTDYISSEGLVEARDALEATVRKELNIPFNPQGDGVEFEHSMGQGQAIPNNILRSTSENY